MLPLGLTLATHYKSLEAMPLITVSHCQQLVLDCSPGQCGGATSLLFVTNGGQYNIYVDFNLELAISVLYRTAPEELCRQR